MRHLRVGTGALVLGDMMFDSTKDLLTKIELGESTFLEFKEVRFAGGKVRSPHRNALADGLAALANSRGGVFVLGVEDKTHEVIGIDRDRLDAAMDFVREVCSDSIEPALEDIILDRLLLPSITGEEVAVIKIEVPRSLFVHRSPGGYIYRFGHSKRAMSPEYLARLFQQRSQNRFSRFDEQVVAAAKLEDLPPDVWKHFRTMSSQDSTETFLTKIGMVAQGEGGVIGPTVAGILMGSADPRKWLPNAFVQAVAYRGDAIRIDSAEKSYQLDAMDFSGPLNNQIIGACRFVVKNMKVAAFKDQGRIDRPQYDMQAVFEALVNAVAHRDYSIYGSKVRLRLFGNRLEIYSPGRIANSLTVDSLAYRQAARNEAVCSLLAKCEIPDDPWLRTDRKTMMERRGEGVPLILSSSMQLSGKEPKYEIFDDAELRLTIFAAEPKRYIG